MQITTTRRILRAASAALLLATTASAQYVIAPESLPAPAAPLPEPATLKAEIASVTAALERDLRTFGTELKSDTQRLSTSALVASALSASRINLNPAAPTGS
ncbi:MAG: hypothetical protein RL376_927 [Verrucomicrobiota bacterium]|jgi:hypothetical protein